VSADDDTGGTRQTVCVTGASSQLGVFLLPRLRAAGFGVLAVSRAAPRDGWEAPADEYVQWLHPDGLFEGAVSGRLAGPLKHLVSCGPLTLAHEIVLHHGNLQRVIAFSSSSVWSKVDSRDARERHQMTALVRQEQDLTNACSERDLPLLLLRPTLIYGCGRDRNVSYLATLARRLGVVPLAGRATGLRQPVHADDLAGLCVRALTAAEPIELTSEACGGSTLSYRDMVEKASAAAPGRHRLVTLPVGLMGAALWLVSRLPGWRGLSPAMAGRQNRDLVFDDSDLRELLGWSPRPFEPTAADFEVPDFARAMQLPRQELEP